MELTKATLLLFSNRRKEEESEAGYDMETKD